MQAGSTIILVIWNSASVAYLIICLLVDTNSIITTAVNIQEQAKEFLMKAREDVHWAETMLIKFMIFQKDEEKSSTEQSVITFRRRGPTDRASR